MFFRKINGLIGEIGYAFWWKQTFTRSDDRAVRAIASGLIAGIPDRENVKHPAPYIAARAVWMLSADRRIAWHLLRASYDLVKFERQYKIKHFTLSDIIPSLYRLRDDFPEAHDLATRASWDQVKIAARVYPLLKAEDIKLTGEHREFHPRHAGAYRLRIDLGRSGEHDRRDELVANIEKIGFTAK